MYVFPRKLKQIRRPIFLEPLPNLIAGLKLTRNTLENALVNFGRDTPSGEGLFVAGIFALGFGKRPLFELERGFKLIDSALDLEEGIKFIPRQSAGELRRDARRK